MDEMKMKDDTKLLLDLLTRRELRARHDLALKLAQIKRECSPEFAARVQETLRREGLLPPDDKARQ